MLGGGTGNKSKFKNIYNLTTRTCCWIQYESEGDKGIEINLPGFWSENQRDSIYYVGETGGRTGLE
jgi:hypothetical protein